MTTATRHAVKVCANPECGQTFQRRPGQSDGSWTRTDHCKADCTPSKRGVLATPPPQVKGATWQVVEAKYVKAGSGGDRSWRTQAACRFYEPEMFFPVGTTGPAAVQAEEAKEICRACPALEACREWALQHLEFGIAGALDEQERATLRRRNARTRAKAS